jgi:hypothetical protein
MCDTNGFTGICEVDFQIIMDLWLKNKHTNSVEMANTRKVAITTMINLYNTCRYFRNLLDDSPYFQQFQSKIGYKMFNQFADIDSLNELIKCLPITTKQGNKELTNLAAGNIVSLPLKRKNYRIINASDSRARMIEIDIKGIIIGKKIMELFSKIVDTTYLRQGESTSQWWRTSTGRCIDNSVCVKDRWSSNITCISDSFIRTGHFP